MGWTANIRALQMLVLGRHPNEMDLAAFVDGGLPGRQQQWIERHLAACDNCCDQVGVLVKSQGIADIDVEPELLRRATLLGRPVVTRKTSSSAGSRWVLATAVLASASAAVAIAIGLLLSRSPTPPRIAVSPTAPLPGPSVSAMARETPLAHPSKTNIVRSSNVSAHVVVISPQPGSRFQTAPPIRWRKIPQAVTYDVRLVSANGDVLWTERVGENRVAVPPTVSLISGKYFVLVRAFLSDGKTVDSSAVEFSVAPGS